MKGKYLIVFSLLILILGVGAVSASDSQGDLLANETDSLTVNGDTFNDIQTTINNAKDNDVIALNGTYTSSKKAVNINKGVTLEGNPDATIDCKNLSSAFVIKTKKTVTLKNLNIINSNNVAVTTDSDLVKSSNIVIINCTFINNVNNDDYSNGGAIYKSNDGKLTVVNSTFEKNKASYGGALFVVSGDLEIKNSSFTSNVAFGDCGAVYSGCNNLVIDDSRFINNTADEIGALSIEKYDSGNARIANSIFTNNTSKMAGAIRVSSANLVITNSTFADNKATSEVAGDIYTSAFLGSNDKIQAYLKVYNSTFSNSYAKDEGDSIYTSCIDVVLDNVSVSGNSSANDVYIYLGSYDKTNSTIDGEKYIAKDNATLKASSKTVYYDSNAKFRVDLLIGSNVYSELLSAGDGLGYRKIELRVYTGSKYQSFTGTTWEMGNYEFKLPATLSVGKHKVVVISKSKYYNVKQLTKYVTVKKAKTTVKAPKVTAKYKKSKYFKATIKHKTTKKVVKNVKVKVKVYTGKKYRTFNLKTDKKGVIKFNTKSFKRGTHKVKITSSNKNYEISKTSSFKIK